MEEITLLKAWIPTPLHRAVKTEASRRGLTIQDFVMSALRAVPAIRTAEKAQARVNGKDKH